MKLECQNHLYNQLNNYIYKPIKKINMPFDKPKVTIDLDEYNELLQEKDRIIGDEYVKMAKVVIASLLNSHLNLNRASEEIQRKGIIFAVTKTTYGDITPEQILIAKIKDTNAQ